ncbi:MAG: Rid family detoxifying hydrolase [Bacteroidales bacterium]|nr:Rid family detoxifying hydrolase [Bacteroidales bacterium]
MKKVINISNAPKPIAPYSQAIFTNGILYISMQIPIDPYTGNLITGDIKFQTKQILENIKSILKEVNMDLSNIVKCSIFISDMKIYGEVNEVYGSYFKENPPAREAIQVAGLPMNVDIGISCIAVE